MNDGVSVNSAHLPERPTVSVVAAWRTCEYKEQGMSFLSSIRRLEFTAAASLSLSLLGSVAAPGEAHAANNVDAVEVKTLYFPYNYLTDRQLSIGASRYAGNPEDPIVISVVESGSNIVVTLDSDAAGGIVTYSPCSLSGSVVTCPRTFDTNKVVKRIQVVGSGGDDDIEINVPSLPVSVSAVNGDDYVEVLACMNSNISGGYGNDTLIGGTGTDTINGDQGTDYIYGYTDPAGADALYCGSSYIESAVDVVVKDGSDTVGNSTNCSSIITGP